MQLVATRNCCTRQRVARDGVALPPWLRFGTRPRDPCGLQRVFALAACFLHGFCALSPRARDGLGSVACDTWPDAAMHCGKLCGSDPTESAICFWLLCGESTLKTNVKSEGAVQQRCVFIHVCSRPRDQWSRCAHQGRSMGLRRRRRRERNGELPPIAAAVTTSSIRRRFVEKSYVRQVISEGALRAPGAQYIWFGSFLPPLARHSS